MAPMANFCHTAFAWAHTDYWLEYVPSKANIADGPSRRFYDNVRKLGGKEVPMVIPTAAEIAAPQRLFAASRKWSRAARIVHWSVTPSTRAIS